MINEELKTFISKMRAAGKTDPEITAKLKTAGWEEGAINRELSPKARLNFAKVKFWLLLYGIAILLFLTLGVFSPITSGVGEIVLTISMIYMFGIVPIATLLAIGFKLFFWILKSIPYSKDLKSFKQLDHKWLLVIANAITGAIMLLLGYLGFRIPNGGMGIIVMVIIAVLGGFLLILSLIFSVLLIIAKKIEQRKKIGLQTIRSTISV